VITPVNSTPYSFSYAAINAVKIQADGKIIAAGNGVDDLHV